MVIPQENPYVSQTHWLYTYDWNEISHLVLKIVTLYSVLLFILEISGTLLLSWHHRVVHFFMYHLSMLAVGDRGGERHKVMMTWRTSTPSDYYFPTIKLIFMLNAHNSLIFGDSVATRRSTGIPQPII